ncbi:MAG: response regulator, partial [Methylococcales bacterium]|nr:response regulator [Methylococcales bacterium]
HKENGNILLVEDVKTNQMIAKKMLRETETEITIANNGKEAVQACQKKRFDVIFMDCRMPVMDGYEATRAIREMEASMDDSSIRVPIIALTANVSEEDKLLCTEAGMDSILT